MIGNHSLYNAPPCRGRSGVAITVLAKGDQSLPECPATTTRPRAGIDAEGAAECISAGTGQQGLGNDQVAGRVADPRGTEVDHRAQLAVADQQVALSHVTVEPDRFARPARRYGVVPHRPD